MSENLLNKILDGREIVAEYEYKEETNEVLVTITKWLSKEEDAQLKKDILKQLATTKFIIRFM
jgi:hypothetical protein